MYVVSRSLIPVLSNFTNVKVIGTFIKGGGEWHLDDGLKDIEKRQVIIIPTHPRSQCESTFNAHLNDDESVARNYPRLVQEELWSLSRIFLRPSTSLNMSIIIRGSPCAARGFAEMVRAVNARIRCSRARARA